ncbi:Oxidoreductase, molybdopterin-binding domain protein [Kalmanozyma brasiliensis GHG001]|uniref:Sulfite oxidase n=1 Tax=Kalmanozyma brasiliensis (strain GHG001) TaxID=1365824 RepID=V5ELH8_KALBG|nr:Oxidoreductase, molybdopterin-binding domain protein [Kalmanozyma brasiliensis GHG001]EST05915.1 Oxidoreductase, molybdopterin-binding domain protein [Kalmanozyma brasiliensis GHG001]
MSQLVRQESPLNTEPYSKELATSFVTPNDLVFNRNHDSVIKADAPESNDTNWSIGISIEDDERLKDLHLSSQSLPLDSLKKEHDLVEVTATLECAGNRRAELASSHQPAEGIQWGNAVIANVVWGGASLRSVLLRAGVPDPFSHHSDLTQLEPSAEASLSDCAEWARPLHLHLFSAQESTESDDPTRKEYFAASIPLPTALHPNQHCLLAYEYNGTPLTQRHGAPLRAVIPGHVGARWVKWLNGVRVSARENESPPMRQDYKLLVPSGAEDGEKELKEKAKDGSEFRKEELRKERPLQRLEASCSITMPWKDGQTIEVGEKGMVEVKGYAVGQDGSPATQVFVAIVPEAEEEKSSEDVLASLAADLEWKQAAIRTQDGQSDQRKADSKWSWAWTLWQLDLPVPPSDKKWALIARCVTASGVEQEKISQWNLRGFHNRSWSVVRNLSIKSS